MEEKVKERHSIVLCSEVCIISLLPALNATITLQTEKVEWQNKLKELQNCRSEMEVKALMLHHFGYYQSCVPDRRN